MKNADVLKIERSVKMNRREFLESAGAVAVVPLVGLKESPKIPKDLPQYALVRKPPHRVPIICFDDRGGVTNVEEIMRQPIAQEETDISGPMYRAWIKKEDYVIIHWPIVFAGPIWGLVHVEIRGAAPNLIFGTIHPCDETHTECRRQTFIYHTYYDDLDRS